MYWTTFVVNKLIYRISLRHMRYTWKGSGKRVQ